MKWSFTARLAVFFVLLFVSPTIAHADDMIDSLLRSAKETLAPDKRTAVFDIKGHRSGEQIVLVGEIHSAQLRDQLMEFLAGEGAGRIIDSLAVLPQPSLGEKTFGVVTVSTANMRAEPQHAAELVSQAILGTPLRVLKMERGWYYVQTPDEYLGWVEDGFTLMDESEFARWRGRPKVIVTSEYGFTRRAAAAESDVVSDVVAGSLLGLQKNTGACFKVIYPDGRTAFLSKRDGQMFDRWLKRVTQTPKAVLKTARRFIGIPYLWGGTSSKAFDCSGFTKTVYFLHGVMLPRDASQQARVGIAVDPGDDFENLCMGDLLFFGSRRGGRAERVTHVGIYMGNHRFIHESGDVRINSLNASHPDYSAHRRNGFLRATRIIGAGEESGIRKLSAVSSYGGGKRR